MLVPLVVVVVLTQPVLVVEVRVEDMANLVMNLEEEHYSLKLVEMVMVEVVVEIVQVVVVVHHP